MLSALLLGVLRALRLLRGWWDCRCLLNRWGLNGCWCCQGCCCCNGCGCASGRFAELLAELQGFKALELFKEALMCIASVGPAFSAKPHCQEAI